MSHRRSLFALGLLAVAFLTACEPAPSNSSTPIMPPPTTQSAPTAPSPRPNSPAQPPPTTPIKLEKPRILGPVTPALVALPPHMAEPEIRVRLTAEAPSPPHINAARYRGRVETVKTPRGTYVAVNVLPMENYLAGVLSKELYGSWDSEAYRAQAIAARTFALYQILTRDKGQTWDIAGDESSQMYGGVKAESKKARNAVTQSRGQILTAQAGSAGGWGVFCAFYSACTGGATQDPWEAWGDMPIATLSARRVGAPDSDCPKFSWPAMRLGKAELTRILNTWGQKNQIDSLATLNAVRAVVITKRNTTTGRPTEITVTDIRGKTGLLRAEEFRLALLYDPAGAAPRPPSSYFDIQDAGADIILVHGRGYGHGIGMSQWGAQGLAQQGKSAEEILNFYYPGAAIRTAWH